MLRFAIYEKNYPDFNVIPFNDRMHHHAIEKNGGV